MADFIADAWLLMFDNPALNDAAALPWNDPREAPMELALAPMSLISFVIVLRSLEMAASWLWDTWTWRALSGSNVSMRKG